MVNQLRKTGTLMDGLLEGIENEVRRHRCGNPPADDPPREDIDDEGHIDESRPGRYEGEIRDPELVRCRRVEPPIHEVHGAWSAEIRNRGSLEGLAADGSLEAHLAHQALDSAAGDRGVVTPKGSPDLARPVDLLVRVQRLLNLPLQELVTLGLAGSGLGHQATPSMLEVGGWGDRQYLTDRLDPVLLPILIDELHQDFGRRSSSAWAK